MKEMLKKLKGLLIQVLLLPLFPVFCEVDPDEDGGQLGLEKLTLSVKGIADNIEEMDGRLDARVDERLKPFVEALNKQLERDGRPRLGGYEDGDDSHDTGGFDSLGELIAVARFDPGDSRIRELEQRALSAGTGASGGFAVPTQHIATLLRAPPDRAFLRALATVLPAGEPPDAPCEIPALDQSGSKGLQAGVEVHWIGEGATKPATSDKILRLVTLEPHEVAAHVVVTDKLLRNWALASKVVPGLLGEAIVAEEENCFISGTGGGRPLGFFGHSASIEITRHGAGHIEYVDLAKMVAKAAWGLGPFIWITSQTVLEDLLTLTDGSGRLIWTSGGNAIDGFALRLLGMPLHIYSGAPTLGSKGDLMLVAPKAILIKDGSPLRIEASPHVYFTSNKTIIKASWNTDSKPWLNSPLTLKDGETEVSPFVVLN